MLEPHACLAAFSWSRVEAAIFMGHERSGLPQSHHSLLSAYTCFTYFTTHLTLRAKVLQPGSDDESARQASVECSERSVQKEYRNIGVLTYGLMGGTVNARPRGWPVGFWRWGITVGI
jgi:hypothetical protein